MNTPDPASSIPLGRFTLLPGQRRVLRDGMPVRLGARAVDLLYTLLARRGEIVGKDELLASVWPGVVVEENNLHVQVSALRKLQGRDAIVTVSGRGYTLAGTIGERDPSHRGAVPAYRQPDEILPPLRGRAAEAATLRRLVREHRLVTVVGPAGVGKTRLVHDVLAGEPNATVRHIEAGAADRDFAFPEGTQALKEQPEALLLLENAEHSLEASSELADQLAQAPNARMVCTSQVPLNARGEHVLRLAPLAVPAPDAAARDETAPALQLMLDLVAALQPSLALDEDDRRDAAAICRHLDGLPLAIALAAARVPLLGFSGVRRRLADRFLLLAGAPRGTVPRRRSLLAAMEWNWMLLTVREREALVTLSHLHPRFSLHAATASLRPLAGNEWQAMELVRGLVDKSLVLGDSHATFRILESTRLFAHSRLAG